MGKIYQVYLMQSPGIFTDLMIPFGLTNVIVLMIVYIYHVNTLTLLTCVLVLCPIHIYVTSTLLIPLLSTLFIGSCVARWRNSPGLWCQLVHRGVWWCVLFHFWGACAWVLRPVALRVCALGRFALTRFAL